jgi:hypothetical protein
MLRLKGRPGLAWMQFMIELLREWLGYATSSNGITHADHEQRI